MVLAEQRLVVIKSEKLLERSEDVLFRCCRFTSTETIRLIRDGEPRTATWTFTQLLITVYMSFFFL